MTTPNAISNTEDFEFAALREANNYRAALLKEFGPYLRGRVLEVGAGVGQLTAGLRALPAIQSLTSIEPDAGFCANLRRVMPDHDLVEGTVADLKTPGPWNAIFSVNVLEHIEDDRGELASYARLLKEAHGALCLFVPARQEIYAPIDKDFGHFRRYSKPELEEKLRSAGFTSVNIRYYNMVGYFLWWMNFCVLKHRGFKTGSVHLFDRTIFPIVHAVESNLVKPPIGQSLIVMAQS